MLVSFPRLLSRTQGFRLGRPQRFTVSADGKRLLFLRSAGGEDPVRRLWSLDLGTGKETLLAEPPGATGAMSAAERARRERARDRSAGISDYSADSAVRRIACTAGEKLFVVDPDGQSAELPARTPLTGATLSPDGTRIAYVHAGELRVIGADGTGDRAVATPETQDVTYGLAEHVAAESMARHRGFWWSPDGRSLAVARVDNEPVEVWYLSDPSEPAQPPTAHRYPVAGTANADVQLWIMGEGEPVRADFGWDDYEYLVDVVWDAHGLMAVVQNRPQTVLRVLAVDPATGRTDMLAETTDPSWTHIAPGFPRRTGEGSLVWTLDDGDTRRLTVDGRPVTPDGLQVSELCAVEGGTVFFTASDEPVEMHVWSWSAAEGLRRHTTEPGRHEAFHAGGTTVISSATLDGVSVTWPGGTVREVAAGSPVVPKVSLLRAGRHELRTAVLFPAMWQRGERLPVLMDPYGGPAGQRAVADRRSYFVSQWFADQGFAVIVADGRGTPGRGPRWDREARGRSSTKLLEDQIVALQTVAALYPELDLDRVGIRGWSAGGYLAALAVLRRPDVFHAAVAGAPVTDLRLYDTHWQERYLGDPRIDPGPYEQGSLIADAATLSRPLMLIHGLRDDNVYPVHTMRLSAALLAAGKPHTVLPLPGASHMPPDADLLTPELHFLRAALGSGS